jgi:hypothetical protein
MTIAAETSQATYAGNSATTDFAYPGRIFSVTDLEVRLEDGVGGSILQTYPTNYTVSGVNSLAGGLVKFAVAPTGSQTVKIKVNVPATQSMSIRNQGNFFPEIHEDAFDRSTRSIQSVKRMLERALRDYDYGTEPSMYLPSPQARASKYLGFDTAGVPIAVAAAVPVQSEPGVYIATVGGSGNAVTLTPSPALGGYVAGQMFQWIVASANTGAVTVNISGLGAVNLTKNGATALVTGDLLVGALITMTYDGTRFQLVQYIPMTAAAILTALLTVDGAGSGLDADLLDGISSAAFAAIASARTITGLWDYTTNPTINGLAIGYKEVPQNSQSGNYTLLIGDNAKHVYHPSGGGAGDVYTIPANASVAYPIGTVLTFVNGDSNSISIAITTDTMTLAGTTTTGTRTLAQNGVATAIKTTATTWIISGTGLT